MATATTTITVDNYPTGIENTQRTQRVRGVIAVQASPATYATGGLALSFLGLKDSAGNFIENVSGVPVDVLLMSDGAGLYDYGWNKSTNKLQIFAASGGAANSAPYAELTNGTAIPASVSGDVLRFEAVFARNF